MVARRAPEAAQHRARRPSTPQGSATNRVVDRVSISPALLATASSRQDPPRVNSTPSRRARTHRTMASLAHSAALAAVGARAGAARPPAAPPRPRARAAVTCARPCAPSAARRCVIPAISRALRRHRAPSDPKASQTLKRESTSKMGDDVARRDDDPSPAPDPIVRARRPDRSPLQCLPIPQAAQPSFMGLRKSQALPRCDAPPTTEPCYVTCRRFFARRLQ